MAGVFYAYAVSVDLGLAEQPDASYVATMNEINERIQNPLFFLGFFGAVLFPVAAFVAHLPRRRSGRFRLIVLACVLYAAGSFLVTALANVPLNEELARASPATCPQASWRERGPPTRNRGTSGTACAACSPRWRS